MTLEHRESPENGLTRTEKFTVGLMSVISAAIVLPALVLIVISIVSPGSIDLGPKP